MEESRPRGTETDWGGEATGNTQSPQKQEGASLESCRGSVVLLTQPLVSRTIGYVSVVLSHRLWPSATAATGTLHGHRQELCRWHLLSAVPAS